MRFIIGLSIALAGCGGCPAKPLMASSPVAGPVAAPARLLLSSRPANVLIPPLAEARPLFSFAPTGTYPGVLFVQGGQSPEVSSGILIVRGKTRTFVDLAEEGSGILGWVQVHASYDRRHLWAIMDTVVESPGWELHVLHSADGGASWSLAAPLHKPYYLSGMHELRMRADGSGELVVLHQDGPRTSNSDVPEGYYTYSTKDWGDSWSQTPVHTPDILVAPDFTESSFTEAPLLPKYLEGFSKDEAVTP